MAYEVYTQAERANKAKSDKIAHQLTYFKVHL